METEAAYQQVQFLIYSQAATLKEENLALMCQHCDYLIHFASVCVKCDIEEDFQYFHC